MSVRRAWTKSVRPYARSEASPSRDADALLRIGNPFLQPNCPARLRAWSLVKEEE